MRRLNSRRTNLWVYACLALLALTVALLRLRTYDEPVNRDPATYAVAAREYAGGRELYTDIWDLKPPAVFWTYALVRRAAGRSPACMRPQPGRQSAGLSRFRRTRRTRKRSSIHVSYGRSRSFCA